MASLRDSKYFFTNGNNKQYEFCLKNYPAALQLKANNKCKKPDKLIRLDEWYQNQLPKLIEKRGKDAHLVYDELVQAMEWKQTRGKFFSQLSHLIKINTPRAIVAETKKAFKKLPNIEQAMIALSNLKGVGVTMASALLAAVCPDKAPFMADEVLNSMPDIDRIDYTQKEYLMFVERIESVVNRLNSESPDTPWTPHTVELAIWSHYVTAELAPETLDEMPAYPERRSIGDSNGNTEGNDDTQDCPSEITTSQGGDESADSGAEEDESDRQSNHDTNGVETFDEASMRSEDDSNSVPITTTIKITNGDESVLNGKRLHPDVDENSSNALAEAPTDLSPSLKKIKYATAEQDA